MATKPKKKAGGAGSGKTDTAPNGAPVSSPLQEKFVPGSTDMGPAQWIDVAGIRTRYFDQGSGERIVFIHGAQVGADNGASSAETWNLNFGPLSRYHNTISLDRLGQGYTDNPKTDADYTMHASVQHVIAFLDALGKKPYHLVGHSRGGYVVTRITMERPDLVKSCVPVSSGTTSPGPTRTHLVHLDPPQPEITRQSIKWYCDRYSFNQKLATEQWLDDCYAISQLPKSKLAVEKMTTGGLGRKQYIPGIARQKAEIYRWLQEKGMPCPTLIVWGYNDPGAVFEVGLQLIELFMMKQRKTELRVFNQSGHFVMREHPAGFNRMLDTWVRQNT